MNSTYQPPPNLTARPPDTQSSWRHPTVRTISPKAIALAAALILIPVISLGAIFWWRSERARNAVHPLASRERIVRIGDEWTYSVQADIQLLGMHVDHVRGEFSEKIGPAIVHGQRVMVRRAEADLKASRELPPFKHSHYFTQDPISGAITSLAWFSLQDKTWYEAAPPMLTEPGSWSSDRSFTCSINLEHGGFERNTDRVLGTEVQTTPVGRFNTWVVAEEFEAVDSGVRFLGRGTIWHTPQLGAPVKADLTLRGPLGIVVRGLFVLQTTNVNPDEVIERHHPAAPNIIDSRAALQKNSSDRVQ